MCVSGGGGGGGGLEVGRVVTRVQCVVDWDRRLLCAINKKDNGSIYETNYLTYLVFL